MIAAKCAGPGNGNAQDRSAGFLAQSPFAFHRLQAAAVELQQLGHVLFRLGRAGSAEPGRGAAGRPTPAVPATNFIRSSAMSSLRRTPSPALFSASILKSSPKRMLPDPAGSRTGGRVQARQAEWSLPFIFEQVFSLSDRGNRFSDCARARTHLRIERLAGGTKATEVQ